MFINKPNCTGLIFKPQYKIHRQSNLGYRKIDKILTDLSWTNLHVVLSSYTLLHELHYPGGLSGARGYGSNFFYFSIAFYIEYINGKKVMARGARGGSPKRNSQLFFSALFSKKLELRTVYKW